MRVVKSRPSWTGIDPPVTHAVAAGANWQDWDLSGSVPKGATVWVYLTTAAVSGTGGVRPNGSASTPTTVVPGSYLWQYVVKTDSNGVIEVNWDGANTVTYGLVGYLA